MCNAEAHMLQVTDWNAIFDYQFEHEQQYVLSIVWSLALFSTVKLDMITRIHA